ncbi:hypothetical protein FB451DRAFT_1367726 [Mycena latifolia]|nr:hypothetical protein FB451DRAFT_1367726 [Mycena latifolia]
MALPSFSVEAVWREKDHPSLPILTCVPRPPYTHPSVPTVQWVKLIIVWILGGLVNSTESAGLHAANLALVTVSTRKDGPPLLPGTLPPNVNVQQAAESIPPPLHRTMTDWQLNRGDREPLPGTRAAVINRSGNRCILLNTFWRRKKTHEIAHLVAKYCSPAAFRIFSEELSDLNIGFPRMADLHHEWNLSLLCTFAHGPFDSEDWGVYIPDFTLDAQTGAITSSRVEVHQVKDHFDLISFQWPDPITEAIDSVNAARQNPLANAASALPPAPLATMYSSSDPMLGAVTHPHPVLWRVHYAVLCARTWGSEDIKARIFGWSTPPKTQQPPTDPPRKRQRKESDGGNGEGDGVGGSNEGGGDGDGDGARSSRRGGGGGGDEDAEGSGGRGHSTPLPPLSARSGDMFAAFMGGVPMVRSSVRSSGSGSGSGRGSGSGSFMGPDPDTDHMELSDGEHAPAALKTILEVQNYAAQEDGGDDEGGDDDEVSDEDEDEEEFMNQTTKDELSEDQNQDIRAQYCHFILDNFIRLQGGSVPVLVA